MKTRKLTLIDRKARAAAPKKVALRCIKIKSTEAPGHHEGRVFESYISAFLCLSGIGDSHPPSGGYYKTWVDVTFRDGKVWAGARLDLNHRTGDEAHPGAHIKRHCEFYSGVPCRHMSAESQKSLIQSTERYTPGYGARCADFMAKYALDDDAAAARVKIRPHVSRVTSTDENRAL